MSKIKKEGLNPSLSELVRKFSKNDVIAEMEKEYQRVAAKNVPLSLIDDNSFVKRVQIPAEILDRVAKSIKERGIFNPLVVRPSGSHYELILGRKRYFAAKLAGLKEVPAVIAEVGDEETLLMLLADTRDQREANVVEMALVYQALSEKFDYSQATLADLSHQSRSQVTNTMRILRLPDHVISEISAGLLSYGHAKAIASLSDEEVEEVVRLIHQEKLSVRQTEELAKQYSASLPQLEPDRGELLKETLGAQSVILKKNGVSISFANETERDAFLAKLEKKQ
jgi:ParB family transcriptional regulator, chromosome partitioning protein